VVAYKYTRMRQIKVCYEGKGCKQRDKCREGVLVTYNNGKVGIGGFDSMARWGRGEMKMKERMI
jgi:hypothetical protein